MDKKFSDNFHQTLINQYRELILEAITESECLHKTSLNIGLLNQKMKSIYQSAQHDGLSEAELDLLVSETTQWGQLNKAAA